MNVAFLVREFPVISETFILNQITGLLNRGCNVEILAEQLAKKVKIHETVQKYHLLDRTLVKPWELGHKYIQTYDIVHCHFGPVGLQGIKLYQQGLLQGKFITSFYGFDVSKYPLKNGIDVYRQLFQEGDLFIAITDKMVEDLINLGCPPSKITKLPLGIDLSKHHFQKRSLSSGESIKILTIARLVYKKGLQYAIEAFAEAIKKHPNLVYQIVGDGHLREDLEKQVLDLGLSDKVHLLGWRTQEEIIENLYPTSHIFMLPSVTSPGGNQEGLPLVLAEAQAAGLPIISTRHAGIPEGVIDGQSGFLVAERDVDALADRLIYLIENPHQWGKMGRIGRLHIEKFQDIENLNDKLVDIYQS